MMWCRLLDKEIEISIILISNQETYWDFIQKVTYLL